MIEAVIFWVFATVAVVGALGVILNRSIIYSALLLLLVFLSIAAIFALNGGDFLAVAQTLVYAVGLTIVMLFGIMFTGQTATFARVATSGRRVLAYSIIAVFVTALLVQVAANVPFSTMAADPALVQRYQTEGSIVMLGQLLLTKYALPFEVISILLLVAMVGAILLSKKDLTADDAVSDVTFEIDRASQPTADAEAFRRQMLEARGAMPEPDHQPPVSPDAAPASSSEPAVGV